MNLTQVQKNIINPFPEDMLREEYNFDSTRNRFVLDSIQEAYVSNAIYPEENKKLEITLEQLQSLVGASREVSDLDLIITPLDMRAYLSMYPQNGTFIGGKIQAQSSQASHSKLQELAIDLESRGVYKLYSTESTPLALLEENQSGPNRMASRLLSISPNHSTEYTKLIRKAMGLENIPAINNSEDNSNIYGLSTTDNTVNTLLSNDTGIDLYDWRKNCIPDTDNDKVYYNPVDNNYYYTRRTGITDLHAFDISSFINPQQQEGMIEELSDFVSGLLGGTMFDYSLEAIKAAGTGISEILRFTGKYSEQNANRIYGARAEFLELLDSGPTELTPGQALETINTITSVNPYDHSNFMFSTYLRPRPGSRWMYVVKIPKRELDALSAGTGVVLSYEEYELSSLEKARALTNPEKNKSFISKNFTVDQLQTYIPFVSLRARNYSYQLEDDNITPNLIGGINLPSEVSKINSFMDLLSLCFSYNKTALKDDDMVEMFFTENYHLDHLCVNGMAFTRGIGNINYHHSLPEDDAEPRRILDAFSLLSPTTFSMIYNSFEIFQETQIASEDNYAPWMDWLKAYVYPTLNLLPTEVEKINDRSRRNLRTERKKDVFIRVSRLANSGKSAEEIKLLYANRKLNYKIGNTINNINCNTGQARAVKSALQFWQAITGKTKFRSILRQTILTLRDEVISDEVSRELLKRGVDVQGLSRQGLAATNNPALVQRQIEREINEQIFCGLDVLGGFIETSYLDPKDMNPQKKTKRAPKIGAQPKVKIPAPPPVSPYYMKAKIYQKMIEEAILNFLKALIAGILKDIIEATLGCGPNQSEDLDDSMKNLAFGFVNVNSFLDDVDIVAAAKSAGLYNIDRTNDGTIKEDPTFDQVFSLLSDISLMCTPIELQSMLLGDGTHLLYSLILETISNGRISFPTSQYQDVDGNDEKTMSSIDPTIYQKFEFTIENIREFFIILGEAMRDEELDEISAFAFSPFAAYCEAKDVNLAPLSLRLSIEQLEAQFSLQSRDKIQKINALCDWLRSLQNIQQQLMDFINSLGIMEFYDKLLQLIADLSNYIADSLSELWDSLFGQDVTSTQDPEYTMYMTQMGRDLFYQTYNVISTSHPAAMSPNLQIYNLEFSPTRVSEIVYTVPQSWDAAGGKTNTTLLKRFIKPVMQDVHLLGSGWMRDWVIEDLDDLGIALETDVADRVIGGYNTDTRTNKADKMRSSLALPFSPPTTEPWLFGWVGGSTRDFPQTQHRIGSYALRTSPANLRKKLTAIRPAGHEDVDMEDYYLKLGEKTESWTNDSVGSTLSKPVPIHLSMRSISGKGGVTVYRAPQTPGITPKMTDENIIAQYIPSPADHEPDQDTITYYGLMSGIDNSQLRGLSLGLFADNPLLPSKIQVSDLISNTLRGYIESTIPEQTHWTMNGGFNRLWAAMVDPSKYNSESNKEFITNNEEDWRSIGKILSEDSLNAVSVSNPTEFIDRNINQGYTHESGRRKLPKYMKSFNRPLFELDSDPCITPEESYIAQATIACLQSRMQGFFLNIMSLSRTYPHWGSFGTKVLIADYLTRKIIPELEERQLLNLIYENYGVLHKVYGNVPSNNLHLDSSQAPRENLKNLLLSMFQRFLDSASQSVGNSINRSIYANHTTNKRYRRMLSRFFHKMSINIKRGAGAREAPHIVSRTGDDGQPRKRFKAYDGSRDFGISNDADRERVYDFIENELMLRDENGKVLENVTDLGLLYGAYYFPAPFLIATYLMYYDSEISISRRFSQAYQRIQVEVATADDNLLSALSGQQVFKFQKALSSYPQNEVTWDGLQVTYFNPKQVQSRIEYLDTILLRDKESFLRWLKLQVTVTVEQAGYGSNSTLLNIPGYRADLVTRLDDPPSTHPRDFLLATLDGSLPSLVDVFGSPNNIWNAPIRSFFATFERVPAYREWFDAAVRSGQYPALENDLRTGNLYEFTATHGKPMLQSSNSTAEDGGRIDKKYFNLSDIFPNYASQWMDLITRIYFVFAGYEYQTTLDVTTTENPSYYETSEAFREVHNLMTNWLDAKFTPPDVPIDDRNLIEAPANAIVVSSLARMRSERSRLEQLLIT